MSTVNISYKPEKSEEYVWNWIDENLEKMVAKKVPTENLRLLVDKSRQIVEFKGKTIAGQFRFFTECSAKRSELRSSIYLNPCNYRSLK